MTSGRPVAFTVRNSRMLCVYKFVAGDAQILLLKVEIIGPLKYL